MVESDHGSNSLFELNLFGKPVPVFPDQALIPAKQFNLPHPEHFDSWPATRLNKAPDTNPSIFKGLRYHAGRLENR